jgi:hypothetical protein
MSPFGKTGNLRGVTAMNWLQFSASVIGSVIWPLAILVIVFIFREEVARLLKQAKKLGAAGISVELSERVAAARNSASIVQGEQDARAPETTKLDPITLELARTFPEAAVVQAYRELERVLQQIKAHLADGKPHRTSEEVVQALYDKGEISKSVVQLFEDLRQAKNSAAHAKGEDTLTRGEAMELAEQAKLLTGLLQKILQGMAPPGTGT